MISTKTKIPELTRVIVSIGNEVVMEKTLVTAFRRLKAKFVEKAKEIGGSGTSSSEVEVSPAEELVDKVLKGQNE